MKLTAFRKRYYKWRRAYRGEPPYFPFWCHIGGSDWEKESIRHFIDVNENVTWENKNGDSLPYIDHMEESGFYASAILSYRVNKDSSLKLFRHVVFPMLRKLPNDTDGNFSFNFTKKHAPRLFIDGKAVHKEYVQSIKIKGRITFESLTAEGLQIKRTYMTAVNHPAFIEKIAVTNLSDRSLLFEARSSNFSYRSDPSLGVYGAYTVCARLAGEDGFFDAEKDPSYRVTLAPKEEFTLYSVYAAAKEKEAVRFDVKAEILAREAFVEEMTFALKLETPLETLNTAFDFAKIRACESIYKTKGGLMHSPGGGRYYAALWTNDQCEYANPLFPFIGYETGNLQAVNSYKLFMKFMDADFRRALVTSIVAEGDDYWNGAGDRGDGAMFAYGASRFSLAYGDRKVAEELWSGIEWGIEYSLRKKNEHGVIGSDSDELENRFESGDANLFTSSLLYDGLKSAAVLGMELGKPKETVERYKREAEELKKAIEGFFGGNVEGYETYRYHEGNDTLRAWICIPLAVGIYDRAEGTIEALFSDRLWTKDGLRTMAGYDTFWDRSTLYALRGVFAAGRPDAALERLVEYTDQRLLGEHVPYPVEAYPEGNQRHLAAESALYVRIFTEGLFGIRPTGFRSFSCTPNLPKGWNRAALREVKAFGHTFDVEVFRVKSDIQVKVVTGEKVIFNEVKGSGDTFHITFA